MLMAASSDDLRSLRCSATRWSGGSNLLSVILEAGVFSRQACQRGPVERLAATRDGRQEVVAQQACHRHRHGPGFRGRQCRSDVLEAERNGKTGRLEALLNDQFAIDSIRLCSE